MIWFRRSVAALAWVPVALVGVRLLGWWPCDVACQGGGHYQRLFGYDVLWAALIVYALLAGAALRDVALAAAQGWSRTTCALAGCAGGTALFYLWVAWSLGIVCPFCLTTHGVALAVLFAVAGHHAGAAGIALLFAALGANAAFHHQVVPDVQEIQPTAVNPGVSAPIDPRVQRADAARQRGVASAPVQVDYVLSLQCDHCASQHPALWQGLEQAATDGRIHLTVRLPIRPSDEGSRALAEWAWAAASTSVADFDRFIIDRLNTRSALSRRELLALGGDLPAYERLAATGVFAPLIDADQRDLQRLGYRGSTPFIVITRNGQIASRLVRDIDPVTLQAALSTPP